LEADAMPYVEDITRPLIETIQHTAGLPVRQLAGHARNLEFWVEEVAHGLGVIDGYAERFKRLTDGEREYAEREMHRNVGMNPVVNLGPPLKRGAKSHDLKDLRRELSDAIYALIRRLFKEDLLDAQELDRVGEQLNLDVREIKREKN
jgi:hypothetical protein